MRHKLEKAGLGERVLVDSAGTTAFHAGEAPDARSVAAAKRRGILIDGLRARKVEVGDFHEFDLILALDHTHLQALRRGAPKDGKAEVALFLEYSGGTRENEVPDPYYGNTEDFEYVLDLIESGVTPLIDKLQQHLR